MKAYVILSGDSFEWHPDFLTALDIFEEEAALGGDVRLVDWEIQSPGSGDFSGVSAELSDNIDALMKKTPIRGTTC